MNKLISFIVALFLLVQPGLAATSLHSNQVEVTSKLCMYLEPKEHLIPDDVWFFLTFGFLAGYYLPDDLPSELHDDFIELFKALRITDKDDQKYLVEALTSAGHLSIGENLGVKDIEVTLFHERLHREYFEELSQSERDYLEVSYEKFITLYPGFDWLFEDFSFATDTEAKTSELLSYLAEAQDYPQESFFDDFLRDEFGWDVAELADLFFDNDALKIFEDMKENAQVVVDRCKQGYSIDFVQVDTFRVEQSNNEIHLQFGVENTHEDEKRDLKLLASIPALGVAQEVSSLDAVHFSLSEDIEPGYYVARLSISDGDEIKVEHREIWVE